MPIYEYQCAACGRHVEVLQKISDDPLKDCPECGAPALAKQVSASGFRLGGTGWYETDFKSANKKNLAGDAAKSDAAPQTDKTDKKPAPANNTKSGSSDTSGKPGAQAAS